ncbi:MAG: sulfatase-like hydrolase/transferase [Flavobacteriales bacterium]|nr:sulfatase-like hydrolase/transferase [Flavobacteriales bacterium]
MVLRKMKHLFTAFAASLFCIATSAQQPNVLLIIADDLGLDPTPNYLPGPQKAAMPNLEAMMANGITFDNVWADPLCSPTRSTIITGRYGFRTGVLNANTAAMISPNEVILHRYLSNIGSPYATSLIGKWHLNGQTSGPAYPNFMGVPHYAGLLAGAVADYYAWSLTVNAVQTPRTDYITTAITDLGIEWIGQQTQPWFCWLAYTAPHVPFHLPPLNMHTQGPLPTDQASITANPLPYFLAMVESLDYEMGRLLATIPADELANTVIIFIGDNGTDRNVIQAPHAMNHGKGTLYEGGVHVPPGDQRPRRNTCWPTGRSPGQFHGPLHHHCRTHRRELACLPGQPLVGTDVLASGPVGARMPVHRCRRPHDRSCEPQRTVQGDHLGQWHGSILRPAGGSMGTGRALGYGTQCRTTSRLR